MVARTLSFVTVGVDARLVVVEADVGPVAVVEPHPCGERAVAHLEPLVGEVVRPAQPAGLREVDDEVQAVDVEVDELAVPLDPGDGEPRVGADRRVVRLERGERDDLESLDRAADEPRAQVGDEGVDLRQFWHRSSLRQRADNRQRLRSNVHAVHMGATILS